jgi:hypothetical protein
MIRSTVLCAVLVGLPAVSTAQTGSVRYDQATRFDFELPPGMAQNPQFLANMPKAAVRQMQLVFDTGATLFKPAPAGAEAPGAAAGREVQIATRAGDGPVMIREIEGGMVASRMMGFMGGRGGDAVTGAYTDLSDDSYVEVREFLGRTFRIPGERPVFAWKLTGEAASFLGYPVYQAIATQDSTTIEAWFTPEIPIPAGPAQYGGLPGLILTLAVDSNRVTYTATAVDLAAAVGPIKAPSEGSETTRAEYDRTVAEKQAEMARSRRGRRN